MLSNVANVTSVRLELHDVSKAYGGVRALNRVSLKLAEGEVHGLCGENGAGKSTLIKILTGVVRPDSGKILMDRQPLPLGDVAACQQLGIAAMHQESTAFPDLNAIDNLFLGDEPKRCGGWLLDRAAMYREAKRVFQRLGGTIPLQSPLGKLPLAQRQLVAMARAMLRNCRLLIMDEPTASLSVRETDWMLNVVRQLRDRGVTILYVSHRLEEIFALADRVSVLRDGDYVTTAEVNQINKGQLVRWMVGRELESVSSGRHEPTADRDRSGVAMQVAGLSRTGAFRDISFSLRYGEIVGLAGLVGAGRSELARSLFGVDRFDDGRIQIGERRLLRASNSSAIRSGMALVPEDRQHEGLVLDMTVAANLTMATLRDLTRWGMIRRDAVRSLVDRQISQLQVKTVSPWVAASTLSGGNQQKLVLGKWLATRPRVLILDEPTRGVDVGAKSQFHQLIRQFAQQEMAVLLISSELSELLELSHRILVMREGELAGELSGREATAEAVMQLALPLEKTRPAERDGGSRLSHDADPSS